MDAKQTDTKAAAGAVNAGGANKKTGAISSGKVFRQAEALLVIAGRHAAALARCGWTAKQGRRLEAELARLRGLDAQQASTRRAALRATREQKAAFKLLRVFRFKLAAAVRMALADEEVQVDPAAFAAKAFGRRPKDALRLGLGSDGPGR